ncbi:MAG: transporter substrate-binding domain-containing protein [bacterium]|nr:transporter substrate-binding domain-containing protein [bacterium]
MIKKNDIFRREIKGEVMKKIMKKITMLIRILLISLLFFNLNCTKEEANVEKNEAAGEDIKKDDSNIVKVGLEPFPPLIIDENKGYTVKMLKEIEAISDLKFNITIRPYNRSKKELERGNLDLLGHTPYKLETKEFYNYAQEIDFNIATRTDLYVTDKSKYKNIKKLKIGIPRGNENFASQLLGIPIENFYVGELESLLKMLKSGRIDAFWFERASTMSTLKKLKIADIYYKKYPQRQIPASLAVRKDKKGMELKQKIDSLVKKVNQKKIFKDYYIYLTMPDSGKVTEK